MPILTVSRLHLRVPSSTEHNNACYIMLYANACYIVCCTFVQASQLCTKTRAKKVIVGSAVVAVCLGCSLTHLLDLYRYYPIVIRVLSDVLLIVFYIDGLVYNYRKSTFGRKWVFIPFDSEFRPPSDNVISFNTKRIFSKLLLKNKIS